MRFIENGPNIPDDLLFAQDEGNVVFFCGAGVSMAHAKLSSFASLAQKVMDDLGATEDSQAQKLLSALNKLNENTHTRDLISADHIFSSLKRSFNRNDINRSVANSLKPEENPDLSAHKTILKLARLKSGQTRLITTNFDLLFEACDNKLKSVTRSNLPRIRYSSNDWGIVHLHGKVEPDYSAPAHDGFVLSRSEFGDAYLAQGWARNFVKDVLDKFIAVFIGYSADDPPIRYLLEGLQHGNGLDNKMYAFQSGPSDEAVAQWDEKGVKAIVYELNEKKEHSPLWITLEAWCGRSKDPAAWKKRVLSMGKKGPAKLAPHKRGMIAHLVKSQSGTKAFFQMKPPMPSEWLCVFDSTVRLKQSERETDPYNEGELINPYQLYALDDDDDDPPPPPPPPPPPSGGNDKYKQIPSEAWDAFLLNSHDYKNLGKKHLPKIRGCRANDAVSLPDRLAYIARWVGKVSNQRIAVWWAGQQLSLHPDIFMYVKTAITYDKDMPFPDLIEKAWNTIFELEYFSNRDEQEQYDIKSHIKAMGWSTFTLHKYARASAPYLKRGTLCTHLIPRDNRKKISDHALVRAEVNYPEGIYTLEIPDNFLAHVVNSLRINIEKAVDMEQEFSGWLALCAIEPDEDIEGQEFIRGHRLSGYVLYFAGLFKKLVEIDKDAARAEYIKWRKTDTVFLRLRVWASGLEKVTTEEEYSDEIISLKQDDFWDSEGARDLLLSLKNRWDELSQKNRIHIENKILKGPLKYKTTTKEEHKVRSAHNQLNRLHWLKNQGCKFSFDLNKTSKKLSEDAPEWKSEYAEKTAESMGMRSGVVRIDTDWSSLKILPPSKIIETAEKSMGRDYGQLVEHRPFAGLCEGAPIKALGALSFQLKKGNFPSDFWRTYLSRDCREEDKYRLKLLVGGRITQIPKENFKTILLTASQWFKKVGPALQEKNLKMFEAIWDKFIDTITQYENSSGSAVARKEEKEIDWAGEAINSPSGNLAQLHMTDTEKEELMQGKGYPKAWLSKVDQLLDLPNDAHRYAMVIFALNLSWFHYIDPKWTERKLLKIIEDEAADKNDKDAIWAGFMWRANTPNEDLYIKLKPHLFKMANEKTFDRRRYIEILSVILLSGWSSKNDKNHRFVSNEELHTVLLNAGDNFRNQILWHLECWSKEEENNWNDVVLEFLQEVWPKHQKVRTSKISARLCGIALSQNSNFPAISKEVAQLVSKIGNEHVFIPEIGQLENDEENGDNLASKYPEDYLNLLYAILPDQPERWPYGASDVLKHIEKADSKLLTDPRLIDLKSRLMDIFN